MPSAKISADLLTFDTCQNLLPNQCGSCISQSEMRSWADQEIDTATACCKRGITRSVQKYHLLTLRKGFSALSIVAENSGGIGVTALSAKMNESVAVVFRIARTLVDLGYLIQDPHTKRYGLGTRIWELSEKVVGRLGIVEIAQPVLFRLTQLTSETSSLAIAQEKEFIYVASLNGRQPLNAYVPPGMRTPLSYPTASGRVLLAYSKPDIVDHVLAGGLKRFTPATVTDARRIRAILTTVRKNGVAVVHGEYQHQLSAIAAPIFNPLNACVGAIALSGLTQRFLGKALPQLIHNVRTEAEKCSAAWRGIPH